MVTRAELLRIEAGRLSTLSDLAFQMVSVVFQLLCFHLPYDPAHLSSPASSLLRIRLDRLRVEMESNPARVAHLDDGQGQSARSRIEQLASALLVRESCGPTGRGAWWKCQRIVATSRSNSSTSHRCRPEGRGDDGLMACGRVSLSLFPTCRPSRSFRSEAEPNLRPLPQCGCVRYCSTGPSAAKSISAMAMLLTPVSPRFPYSAPETRPARPQAVLPQASLGVGLRHPDRVDGRGCRRWEEGGGGRGAEHAYRL